MWTELLLSIALALPVVPVVEATPEGDTLVVVSDDRVPLIGMRLALPVGRLSPWWWTSDAAAAWHLPMTDPALAARLSDGMDFTLSSDDWSTTITARFHTNNLDTSLSSIRDFLSAGATQRGALREWRSMGRGPWERAQGGLSVVVQRLLLDPRDLRHRSPPAPPRRQSRLQRSRQALVGLTNRIIGFTGDITHHQAREAAAALLPPPDTIQPEGLTPTPLPMLPVRSGLQTGWLPGAGQGAVVLARDSLSQTDPDLPALGVALHVLAGGVRSRLLVALRHDTGLIYSLSSDIGAGPIPGILTIAIPTRASRLTQTSQQAMAVLADFAANGITPAEHAAAVASLRLSAVPDTPDDTLQGAMEAIRHGWPVAHRQQTAVESAALSTAEINAFISRFFSPDAVVVLRVLPTPGLSPRAP